jgi:hypothetical protein
LETYSLGKEWKFTDFAFEVAIENSKLSATTSSKYYTQNQIQIHIQAATFIASYARYRRSTAAYQK